MFTRTYGLDVSHYQTITSWANVYSAGYKFVWAKATEGASTNDANFASEMSGATAAGVIAGAYHFARPDSNSATTEANHFLAQASSYIGAGYLKPVLDLEVSSLGKTATSTWANTFCNAVLNATGVRPVLYSSSSFASSNFDSTVTQWSPWIASYNGQSRDTGAPTTYTPWSGWSFWQYSQSQSISGISAACDADVYASDVDTLIANHVGKSTQFAVGDSVHVNTSGGLKAWDTYASNGTYVTEPNGKGGTIQGGPVMVNGYLRWKVLYNGDSVARWSAGSFLSAGAGTSATPAATMMAVAAPSSTTTTKDKSTFASTIIT